MILNNVSNFHGIPASLIIECSELESFDWSLKIKISETVMTVLQNKHQIRIDKKENEVSAVRWKDLVVRMEVLCVRKVNSLKNTQ